MSTNT